MLTTWLPTGPSTLPPNASHQVCECHLFVILVTVVSIILEMCISSCVHNKPFYTFSITRGQVGVGALVINEQGQMLVVQERNGPLKGRSIW